MVTGNKKPCSKFCTTYKYSNRNMCNTEGRKKKIKYRIVKKRVTKKRIYKITAGRITFYSSELWKIVKKIEGKLRAMKKDF